MILLLAPNLLMAQGNKAFKITGHAAFYNNQQLMIQVGVSAWYYNYNDFNFETYKIESPNRPVQILKVQHDQFTVEGNLKYPHPISFSYYDPEENRGGSSTFIFADAGTTSVKIDDLFTNNRLVTLLNSKSNKEYQQLKKLYSNSVDTLTGVIHDLKAKQKKIEKYVIQHPDSYVALWDLVLDYVFFIYYENDDDKRILLKILDQFSPEIKQIKTYQALVDNINQDLKLTAGEMFPNIPLASIYRDPNLTGGKIFPNLPLNANDSLLAIVDKNEFTLIDFWFSGCQPCIKQFPDLKNIYNNYKGKYFEIIGISIDSGKGEETWKRIIGQFNLDWFQFLDSKKDITEELNITGFPSNFLLDKAGKIIRRDITPEELEVFLKENLK